HRGGDRARHRRSGPAARGGDARPQAHPRRRNDRLDAAVGIRLCPLPRRHPRTGCAHDHRRRAAEDPQRRARSIRCAGDGTGRDPRHEVLRAHRLRRQRARSDPTSAGGQGTDERCRLVARPAHRRGREGGIVSAAKKPGIQPARWVAYDVLRAVSDSDAYANLLLPKLIADAALDAQDAALATELTYGTLRRRGTYDAIIAVAAGRAVADIDPPVLDVLRLGAHQLLATRVAAHAAVNESVNLVAAEVGRGAAGFANAVLRRIGRDSADAWQERIEAGARSDDERLALRTAHPVWVIRALRRAL